MRHFLILLFCCLSWSGLGLQAQNEYLPQTYSIILGGGVSLPAVEGNKNDFFSKNGNRAGYDILAEGRYYFLPNVGLGLQYDYMRAARLPDKMHIHSLRPNLVLRYLYNDSRNAITCTLGVGYMDYQERTYQQGSRNGHLFHQGYCGISFSLGYEFRIAHRFSGMFRADILTADWFANPDARLFNTDGYDDGANHNWFKNNVTFFNIGFAVQFGK